MSQKFYMIYVKDGGKPNQVYLDYEGALHRAKVLAAETRKEVIIMVSSVLVTAEVPINEPTYTVSKVV